jgi:tRNA(Ile)-lysidine synthase
MVSLDNFEALFLNEINKNKASHYFLAVSGGCDSMVLLHLFIKHKLPCSVLHVNYNLRGIESTQDCETVRELCEKQSIAFHMHSCDLEISLNNGGNLQNKAREIRYAFFKTKLKTIPLSIICLAHQNNDQEENFWLTMTRGGGIRAMSGMQSYTKPYLRPLLMFSKETLYKYAKSENITWREDSSNSSNKYSRNIWRNALLPHMKMNTTGLANASKLLQTVFRRQSSADRDVVLRLLPEKPAEFNLTFKKISTLNSTQWIELLDLFYIPKSLALAILNLHSGPNGKRINFTSEKSHYSVVWKEKNHLVFGGKLQTLKPIPKFKKYAIDLLPETFSKSMLFLDETKIKGQLKIRNTAQGDRLQPIGIKGSKLVSQILKDAKVPLVKRKDICVLVDDEKIISVVNYAIDKRALASSTPCICIEILI